MFNKILSGKYISTLHNEDLWGTKGFLLLNFHPMIPHGSGRFHQSVRPRVGLVSTKLIWNSPTWMKVIYFFVVRKALETNHHLRMSFTCGQSCWSKSEKFWKMSVSYFVSRKNTMCISFLDPLIPSHLVNTTPSMTAHFWAQLPARWTHQRGADRRCSTYAMAGISSELVNWNDAFAVCSLQEMQQRVSLVPKLWMSWMGPWTISLGPL